MTTRARGARASDAPPGVFRRIWHVVACIPKGKVATYGQVARLAGMPGAARMAGWALFALPDGLKLRGRPVPWQRVINAQGRISPRAGDLVGGRSRQLRLLRQEGIRVSRGRRIDLRTYGWDGR